MIVLWLTIALLSCVWLRTSASLDKFECAVAALALHAVYAVSLLFNGRATFINRRTIDADVSHANVMGRGKMINKLPALFCRSVKV